jgi:uncharacterized membrane protein/protein-disulfide isomerase
MATVDRLILIRLLALLALAICAGLLVETLVPGAALCGDEGSCEAVLRSAWARPLGVPLPVLGLGLFAALLGLSLVPGRWPARLLRCLAMAGGAIGLGLLVVQAVILGQFCPFCVIVDLVAAAVGGLALGGGVPVVSVRAPIILLWVGGILLAVSAGAGAWAVAWSLGDEPPGPAPAEVVLLRDPDRVTIVEVVDIHCEHCRQMHRILDRLEDELGDRVYRVCVSVPMPGHPEARDASRAFVCARRQGREKEMARALFSTWKPDARTCRSRADALGLSISAYDACLADPAVDGELDREQAWVKAASPRGLPAVWIQDEFFQGVVPLEQLRAAVVRAERQRPSLR